MLVFNSAFSEEAEDIPETIWLADEAALKCSPKIVNIGGEVVLTLGPNHGNELAIYRESEELWLFLVVGSPPEGMSSLMPPKEFASVSTVAIGATTTGFRWDVVGGNEVVFKKPGKYTVYVSENLESEYGGYKCELLVKNH